MGWTSIDKPYDVKKFIDGRFCYQSTSDYHVIKSSIVNFSEYYAAVAEMSKDGAIKRIFAIVLFAQIFLWKIIL